MDNKYKNGKIYTIRYKNDDSLIYVGSTVTPLYKRFAKHKDCSKNTKYENIQLYKKMKETDMKDWYIELYEDYPCERKEQLSQREGQVIRDIGTLNTRIEGRTKKEWEEANKEHIQEYQKEYQKEYKEKNKEKNKAYDSEIVFCECGCSVRRDGVAKHKRSHKHEKIMKELTNTPMPLNVGQNL
jgi:hypothetical protein